MRTGAYMFWWLYYTTSRNVISYVEKPLLIWLAGGPGGSSTGSSNFDAIGPLDLNLNPRNFTWVYKLDILFILFNYNLYN